MRVLVTRAEPAASRTKHKLEALGYEPIVLPIFELVDLGNPLPSNRYDGVIFTSANAVEVLARRGWADAQQFGTAYCVGSRTGEAAQELGFETCVTASGGGEALCKEIANLNLSKKYTFLYPTTPDRSFDMADQLGALGYAVDSVDVYQTRKVSFSREIVTSNVRECENGVILVYSARSAAYLDEILSSSAEIPAISTISLVGISKSATNKMLKYSWRDVYVSNNPDEETMLSLLNTISSA